MVLLANTARTFTGKSRELSDLNDLQKETAAFENAIRTAANQERYEMSYDAQTIGNPIGDPNVDANLTILQRSFRDALLSSGYILSYDNDNGFWHVSWAEQGPEELVSIYIIRTSLTPGAIVEQTKTSIETYFAGVSPAVRSRVEFFDTQPSTNYGVTTDVPFYEFIAFVDQPNDTDHSSGISMGLAASGLGYTTVPSNYAVYKVE